MDAVKSFFDGILSQITEANFPLLVIIDLCAFAVIFLVTLFGCLFSKKLRAHDKRIFLCAVNAFAAITLAVFLTAYPLSQALAATAVFWCIGYLLYGLLRAIGGKERPAAPEEPASTTRIITRPQRPSSAPAAPEAPAAQSVVRLEHALSIADKLLLKNLGRGDRQELEKIKTALTVLKVKGILSAQEGEALNDMFNALLKFMAKYDL